MVFTLTNMSKNIPMFTGTFHLSYYDYLGSSLAAYLSYYTNTLNKILVIITFNLLNKSK